MGMHVGAISLHLQAYLANGLVARNILLVDPCPLS